MTLPASDTLATYGGELVDYSDVVDPTTDRPAVAVNKAFASLAGCTRMSPRAIVKLTWNGASAPTLNEFDTCVGNTAGYQPTIARESAGIILLTFPNPITDALGDSANFVFRWAVTNTQSTASGLCHAVVDPTDKFKVRVKNSAGAADLTSIVTEVFIY